MRIQVELEESPFRRLLCVGEKRSSDTQAEYLEDFQAAHGLLLSFQLVLMVWQHFNSSCLLDVNTGDDIFSLSNYWARKCLLLLHLRASSSHNMTDTDWESLGSG